MPPPTIFVATWSDGLFALTGDDLAHELANQPIRGLAHRSPGGTPLAIVGQHSLCQRSPDGHWTTLATTAEGPDLSCCLALADAILVGTDDARLLRLTDDRTLKPIESFDHVAGRETWFAGSAIVNGQRLGPPLGIRSLAANSDGTVLFTNVHVGGIPRSTDGGHTWHPTIDIHADVHEVRAHPTNPNIIAAASAIGLCLSRDSGATWTIESDGLHAPHCSAIAFAGNDAILISASVDPFSPQGRIYRRPLTASHGPLTPVEGGSGLPSWLHGSPDTGCLAVSGAMVAAADRGGNLYISEDFGQSWECRSTGIPSPSGVLIC